MLIGLPLFYYRDGVCASCVLDKHHQDNFDKNVSWHALTPLHLVLSDLCGPIYFPSFSWFQYFLNFIDEFSICTWLYFLKHKSEVFENVLAYKVLVEKKYGHQLQRLRTYNRREYVNTKFTSYFTAQGIQM
jgi:hypothetical protein